jgi:hypothetical protein
LVRFTKRRQFVLQHHACATGFGKPAGKGPGAANTPPGRLFHHGENPSAAQYNRHTVDRDPGGISANDG